MSNFYSDVIQKDPRFNSPNACADLAMLEPGTRAAVEAIIADAAKLGYTLRPVETYRSVARQQHFYRIGFTKLKNVGCHHWGLACDLAMVRDGKDDPKGEDYLFLRHLAESHGMISGCDWARPDLPHSFRDYDHIQRCSMAKQDALFAGEWYPDANYNAFTDSGRYVPTAINAPLVVPYDVAFANPNTAIAQQQSHKLV